MSGVPAVHLELAVLEAVVYASVFDYPLTIDETRERLVGVRATNEEIARWCRTGTLLRATVECGRGFYFPRGQGRLVDTRTAREAASRRLLEQYMSRLGVIAALPFVRMLALSGSLAHLNAASDGDVDLFIVAAPGRVWTVAVTALIAAHLGGWRRRLCLNYIVSERGLRVEPCDAFAASQIAHLQPLTGADVYARFLAANPLVAERYPNFTPRRIRPALHGRRGRRASRIVERLLDMTVGSLVERWCRSLYAWHLRRRAHLWASREHVRLETECLKLHTASHREGIAARFDSAMAAAMAHARPDPVLAP